MDCGPTFPRWTVIVVCGLLISPLIAGPDPSPVCRAQSDDSAVTTKADDTEFRKTVQPFLKTYCVRCHGSKTQEADRRFDQVGASIPDDNALVDLQDILDQLNLGQMPPEDEPQPDQDQRRRVVDWLTRRIAAYHEQRRGTRNETILRRLNAREYRNSVRDLFHLNMAMFDPTIGFPRDQTTEHLDNMGDSLVTSGYLLSQYLAAADLVVEKVLTPTAQPKVRTWHFHDGFRQQPEIDQVHRLTNKFEYMTLYDVTGADKHEGAYGPIHAFAAGVPADGYYELRIHAEAVNRVNPYDPEFLGMDPDEPFRLGIVAGNRLAGALHKPQPIEPLLAEIDLADEPQWYTVRVWLDAGYTPRFTFRNGLMDARNLWGQVVKRYRDQFPKGQISGIVALRLNAIQHGKLPQIRIHEIEISGPFFESWPTASQQVVLGTDWSHVAAGGELTEPIMRRHLARFASRAFRRPVAPAEIDRYLKLIASRKQAGRSALEAYGDGLKAILCSPSFLYLEDSPTANDAPSNRLSAHSLAARLACFLWSSIPDSELLGLADSGQLLEPRTLIGQVDRMLRDTRSDAFIEGFHDSWLTLRDLGSSPPDRRDFNAFYHYDLQTAMRRETQLFTRAMLDENLSVLNYLDSDFTFVNKRLAAHYGLDTGGFDSAFEFRRVELPDRRRGGLLGQASVLTVTANGIDTSPVVRGVWLLENLLGTPPSPPPPDVEPLDPDIRGATTIRDQLEKHRDIPSCADCHRKIDPLGFALENFDPIGGWRTRYGKTAAIDASGELPGGQSFADVSEFKQLLLKRETQFLRALSSKLLSYAIGRRITPLDRPHINRVVDDCSSRGMGLRDLILGIVLSEPFQSM